MNENNKNPFLLYNNKGEPLVIGDFICDMYRGLPKNYTYGQGVQPLEILTQWKLPAATVRAPSLGQKIKPYEIVGALINSVAKGCFEDGLKTTSDCSAGSITNEGKVAYILSTPEDNEETYAAIYSYHDQIGFFTFKPKRTTDK